ncbi:MAG: riboflavin synthase [Candidatus Acidiferrales bacterium]
MFTGITEKVGKIESLEHAQEGGRLRVSFANSTTAESEIARETKLGDSISVNGCCLTVVEFDSSHFTADLSGETLRRTNFGEKKPGNLVNLERPLSAGARLGGHFMQGHVDGIGRVTRLVPEGDNWWLSVRVPEDLRHYVAEKGSIAIDGISLTVARWHDGIADIAIIPFTHQHTNVHAMSPNDAVNLETDILAKYVESLLYKEESGTTSNLTVKHLVEEGF